MHKTFYINMDTLDFIIIFLIKNVIEYLTTTYKVICMKLGYVLGSDNGLIITL